LGLIIAFVYFEAFLIVVNSFFIYRNRKICISKIFVKIIFLSIS
jgi:hypothetical protein